MKPPRLLPRFCPPSIALLIVLVAQCCHVTYALRALTKSHCDEDGVKNFRLPKTVEPTHYSITLWPNLKTFKFDGWSAINLTIKERVNEIVLNAQELDIQSASFTPLGAKASQRREATHVCFCPKQGTAKIQFRNGESLEPQQGLLRLKFNGTITDRLEGLYRSRYLNPKNASEIRYSAVTQFEPIEARRAFPCWDEPAIKAYFDLTLIAPEDFTVLSNTEPIAESKFVAPSTWSISADVLNNSQALKEVKFKTSPKMSTYLVALVIGEYQFIENRTEDGIRVRVYTPPGRKGEGKFGLEVASRCLDHYRHYFQVGYPLEKLDLVPVNDFSAGAMENWGLITSRERLLLYNETTSSHDSKEWVALVVSHEVAHQWFGNLVTMQWWTQIWLNEGFAEFMMYSATDALYPEFDVWTDFVTDTYATALDLDARRSSHPIEVPIEDPSEIVNIFDTISYNKGASVLRMLHQYIGDEAFRNGLSLYLSRHQYKNTCTEDLWAAFEEVSQKPIRMVMDSWTKQKGFPIIYVNETIIEDADSKRRRRVLQLRQEKFNSDGILTEEEQKMRWYIPITLTSSKNPTGITQEYLMSDKESQIVLDEDDTTLNVNEIGDKGYSESDWVKLNHESVGFYRVSYAPSMLDRFIEPIRAKTLSPLNRLNLQSDLFAEAKSSGSGEQRLTSVDMLKFLTAFKKSEDNYFVWNSVSDTLNEFNFLTSHTDYHDEYLRYARTITAEMYRSIDWEPKPGESPNETQLRALIINQQINARNWDAIHRAAGIWKDHRESGRQINPNMKPLVLKAAALTADEDTFESFFDLYKKSDVTDRALLGRALAMATTTDRLRRVLKFAISDSVRLQDAPALISSVAANKFGRVLAWDFFRSNVDLFRDRYSGSFLMVKLITGVCSTFASHAKAIEVEEFFEREKFPGHERHIRLAIESIRAHANWLNRDTVDMKEFLTSYSDEIVYI